MLISGTADAARQSTEKRTVASELARLQQAGAIEFSERQEKTDSYKSAKALVRRLEGRRRIELGSVVDNLEDIAAKGDLTASRLAPLWLILQRNREWWTSRELPANGTRVSFPGSELVFQYYTGQGFQLQPLANFGKLNALWQGGSRYNTRLGRLFDELLALAAERAGGRAWEYYFEFANGEPPWTSGMSQGVAVQALARAGVRLGREDEAFEAAFGALPVFERAAPEGVRVTSSSGTGSHYLLYSFNKDLRVLNGFAQSLVGLYDFSVISGDARVAGLFNEGNAALKLEAPAFDTGAWSLYGATTGEASLNYHMLNRDFLKSLCARINEPVYCQLQQNFTAYLTQPPAVGLITGRVRGGEDRAVRFTLSKMARVTMTILRDGRTVFTRTETVGHGKPKFRWDVPRRTGAYEVRLAATDLAGNAAQAAGTLEVTKPKPKKKKPSRPKSGG